MSMSVTKTNRIDNYSDGSNFGVSREAERKAARPILLDGEHQT